MTTTKTATDVGRQLLSGYAGKQTPPDAELSAAAKRAELVSVTLWERLTDIFGPIFPAQYGDIDSGARQTWKRALAGFTEDQIRRGLQHCTQWRGKYPPNLAEFTELCLTETPQAHRPFDMKRLEVQKARPEVRERELAKMRAILHPASEAEAE